MDVRHPANPADFEAYTTERTRAEFLVTNLFVPGKISLTYSHIDRMIVGGACPTGPLALEGGKALGTDFFLQRRELGVINVGGPGSVEVDGTVHKLAKTDCLYVGLGTEKVVFDSADPADPAHFYLCSGPAHAAYPTVKTTMAEAEQHDIGDQAHGTKRKLNKYIHPDGVKSCNLVMGITAVQDGSVWNSIPCHTHDRRMEVYFYFDLPEDEAVFHIMGQPDKTRHIVVRNEEAVISPSWSIHCGAGTTNYAFIWGMVGDNQAFTDMDAVPVSAMK